LNAQLPDGSRLAAVLPPVVRPICGDYSEVSKVRFTIADLIQTGAMTTEIGDLLRGYIEEGKTVLISGGTGSGKTTLLNALADFIPEEERIVVIEDTSECVLASRTYWHRNARPITHRQQRGELIRRLILDELSRDSGEPNVSAELSEIVGIRLMLMNVLKPAIVSPSLRVVRLTEPSLSEGIERQSVEGVTCGSIPPQRPWQIASSSATRSVWTLPSRL